MALKPDPAPICSSIFRTSKVMGVFLFCGGSIRITVSRLGLDQYICLLGPRKLESANWTGSRKDKCGTKSATA